ncbi:MAG: phosphohistidine phosphatase SixA [Planctomycetes bacterium]|nr:phosphohistidine phosphatase SixA [Planctomycetota bacterium]
MRIYLMRHATAEETGSGTDAARPLTERGRREARAAAVALRELEAQVAAIISSPRLRARETAEIVATAIGRDLSVEVRSSLDCGATLAALRDELEPRQEGEVLLVGHNPELSQFASALAAQAVAFRPSTVCCFEVEGSDAKLLWLRHPGESE